MGRGTYLLKNSCTYWPLTYKPMGVWFNVTVTQHIYYSTVEKKHSFPEVSSRGWHSLTMTSVSIIICLHVCSRTVDNMKIIKKNKLSVNR